VARTKFSKFSTAGPDGPDTDTQKQVARTIRVPCANGGRWPYQNHDPQPVPGPSGDHSAESADIGSRMAATHRRVPRRVLIAVFTLALASATVLMAIRSTHFLYLLYIVVSLLVGMVALSTRRQLLCASAFSTVANASQVSRPKVSTGPRGSFESRTSTALGTVATSAQLPEAPPL
jgi:hypothetical protein